MKQFTHSLTLQTKGAGLYIFTAEIERWVSAQKLNTGLLTAFVQHTSASLTIQENADPDVIRDLHEFFRRLVPENQAWFRHTAEGADDMPAHIKAALTATQVTIPLAHGRLALGIWQGVYLFEHRSRPHTRTVMLHLIGE